MSLIYTTVLSFAHPHSVSRDVRILQTPSAELPTVTVGYSTTASHEPSARGTPHKKRVGGGGGAIPNEVGTPQPGLTPLRPSKDDAGGPLIHEVSQAVARGATDGPLLKRPPKADGAFPVFLPSVWNQPVNRQWFAF